MVSRSTLGFVTLTRQLTLLWVTTGWVALVTRCAVEADDMRPKLRYDGSSIKPGKLLQ